MPAARSRKSILLIKLRGPFRKVYRPQQGQSPLGQRSKVAESLQIFTLCNTFDVFHMTAAIIQASLVAYVLVYKDFYTDTLPPISVRVPVPHIYY